MATAPKIAYPHITKDPEVRAGKACIDGTRIAVVDIALLHKNGRSVDEICKNYMRPLTPAQVHAALLYYYDYTEEIETYLSEAERIGDEIDADPEGFLRRHIAQ